MNSKLWLLNLALAGCAVFFGIKTHEVWVKNTSEIKIDRKTTNPEPQPTKKIQKRLIDSEAIYSPLVDKNLFSPERKEYIPPEPVEEKKEPEKPQPQATDVRVQGKKITLYGIVMLENFKAALIDNPETGQGQKKNIWINEGQSLGNLSVAEIRKESILLAEGTKTYEIPLYGEKQRSLSGNIAGNPAQPNIVITDSSAPPNVPTSVPVEKTSEPPTSPAAAPSIENPAQLIPTTVSIETQPKPATEAAASDDEYEIIDTPFGKIKRKKIKTQ